MDIGITENGELFTDLPVDGREEYLKGIGDDAAYLAETMKGLVKLGKAADKAVEARDEFFSTKMKIPAFADRVQRVRDWGSTKRNNEVLTIDGRKYTSVKKFFKQELGVSYEYVLRFTAKKLPRLNFLLGDDDQPQGHTPTPAPPAPARVNAPPTPAHQPAARRPESVPPSLAEKVQSAFQFVLSCAADLSGADRDEFYEKLICRLLNQSEE
jgi:hypothetical protein